MINIRNEEILKTYKNLKKSRDLAAVKWIQVDDDSDNPSYEYVCYRARCCELRGFCTALELMGYDMEILAAVTDEEE